jgi:hypothetical protein
MEVELIKEVKELVKKDPNWVETFDTRRLKCLAAINSDILEEEIHMIDKQGFRITRRIIPKHYLNRYTLYQKLRENKRVKKNEHGEAMLKKSKEK